MPELVYAEIASALTQSVRAGLLLEQHARGILDSLVLLPLQSHAQAALAPASFALALERGLSAYDASYVALAQSLDSSLVTADRRLAAAASVSELIA